MTTLAQPHVHPNGSQRVQAAPVMAPASLIGRTLATARPRTRAAALAAAVGRGWRAFRPAALPTAGCASGTAAAFIALGLWPALLAAGTSFFLLDWLSKPAPPPRVVVEDPDDGDGGGR